MCAGLLHNESKVKVPFYDIKAQHDECAEEIETRVLEILRSGTYTISGGKECPRFEAEMAELHQVKHAISCHSGTDALRIMLDAAGIGPGDEVITTAFTFVASVETIVQTGATPVFVDIDPKTYHIDPNRISAAITNRTKAILPVHLFGQLCDIRTICEIAEQNGLFVLEDAAQAIGAENGGKFAGNFGLAGSLSFYVTKNLGAAGDAGLIVTNDDAVNELCRSIRIHGMGRQRYYYDHLGYTSRMDEIQAAVLSAKLKKLGQWTQQKQALAKIYDSTFSAAGVEIPLVSSGNNHTYHQYSIRSERRDELQAFLKGREIDSMVYYPVPIHFHSPYSRFGLGKGSLPITERASQEILNLPIHPHLTPAQVEFVAESIVEFSKMKVLK